MKLPKTAAIQDLKHFQQLNAGNNGVYFILDSRDGIIYQSDYSLPELIDMILGKSPALGVIAAAAIPMITAGISAVASLASGGFSLLGKNKDAETQQANLAAQQKIAQYQTMQSQQQQKTIVVGLMIAGGVGITYLLLK